MKGVGSLCTWLGWSCAFLKTQTPFLETQRNSTPNNVKECRCLASEPCWPPPSVFATLAAQVSQPLLFPTPPAKACYPPTYVAEDCARAVGSWDDGFWRSDEPGAMQSSNFEAFISPNGTIEACYLDATLGMPCGQGNVPAIGVDARSVADIQAAVRFAVEHNLRLVIKNTGHCYLGRSTARGAFVIWTHHLKDITYHETFRLAGAPAAVELRDVMTLGAGVQWQDAYDFAFARQRDLVGGLSAGGTVGAAGGWLQGGGHSALAPKYGLGVDNVVQITIVTAAGRYLTVNEYQHPDLFWALRGGGGGTWGVVVSVTYQTHPSTPLIAVFFASTINSTAPDASSAAPSPLLKKLFTEFVRMTPAMADDGWSGYAEIVPSVTTGQPALQFAYIAPNVSWEVANRTMTPFLDLAQDMAANSSAEDGGKLDISLALNQPMPSFASWETMLFRDKTGQVGSNVELATRLLPRDLIRDSPEKVAETILSLTYASFYVVTGGVAAEKDPDSTGLNPVWRKALAHVVYVSTWLEGSSSAVINQARDRIKGADSILRGLAPDSGAYFNEASMYEVNPQETFFGSYYDRLRAVKRIYDPLDLFLVHAGVGSSEWDADLHCRV